MEELTHWKRLWCWEGLGAEWEEDDRGWDGWMASPTRWTWVWVKSERRWWTRRPGVLRFMGSQRVGHDLATELNWNESTNVVSHSFKNSGERLETLIKRSNTKDLMTSFSHWFPLPPKSYGSDACMGPGGWHTCKSFQSQLKDPEMRKLLSCLRKYKPTYLIFSTQTDIIFIFLDSKQTCPLSWREIIPLFSKAACYMNILEKIVKSWQYFCSDKIQKHKRPMESCLPII